MNIKTKTVCPLGGTCSKIVGEEIHQCAWLMTFTGTDPQTGEALPEKGCAMNWIPLLLVENTAKQASTVSAVETFRNAMVEFNLLALSNGCPPDFTNLRQIN